jgi:hypothetical protein
MKIGLAICAEKIIIDGATGEVSLINIMERLIVGSFPVFIPRICFAAFLERQEGDPNDVLATVTISHGDREVGKQAAPISFSDIPWFRYFTTMTGIPIYGPGKLTFSFVAGNAEYSYQLPIMLPPLGARLFDGSPAIPADIARPIPEVAAT